MMYLKSGYKLITFDVTNTLLKFKISVGERYAKVGHIYGIERNPEEISIAFRKHWKSMNDIHPNFGCNSGLSSYIWWKKLVEKTFCTENNELSSKQLDTLSNHLYDIYKKNVCWEVVPGAISLLELLKKENLHLGVISNFDERLESVLSANDLKMYFDFILPSYVVKVAKPSKEIFDMALNKSSFIASQALHVGDDLELDYHAAKKAGWNAVLVVNRFNDKCLPKGIVSDEVVQDISELESFIFHKSNTVVKY